MTNRFMVDIETMSTDNANALILSIGVVKWVMNKNEVIFTECSDWVLDPREQFTLGRTTMDSTIKWWQDQPAEARGHWLNTKPVTSGFAINGLRAFLSGADIEVWANGIVFDLGNIASLCKQIGEPTPWKYNAAQDARTMYRHSPQFRSKPDALKITGVPHTPIYDCKQQIWGLWEHWDEVDLDPVSSAGTGGVEYPVPSSLRDLPPIPVPDAFANHVIALNRANDVVG